MHPSPRRHHSRWWWPLHRRLQACGGAFGLWLRERLLAVVRRIGPAELSLYEDAFAQLTTQALRALTTAGVFDVLTNQPQTAEELLQALAHTTEQSGGQAPSHPVDPVMLVRLLRFGSTKGWVRISYDGRYAAGALAGPLRTHARRSLAPMVTYAGSQATTLAMAQLGTVLARGGDGFHHAHGVSPWHYFAERPNEGAVFDAAMRALSDRDVRHVARALPPAQILHVCDLAGGDGGLLAAILATHPHARGTLLERPAVAAAARTRLAEAGCGGRAQVLAGDLFGALPAGASAYLLRNVLHDWPDAQVHAILTNVAKVLAPAALLYVIETLDPKQPTALTSLSDVAMAVVTDGGQQRSLAHWRALGERAGLLLKQVVPLPQPMHMLAFQRQRTGVR